MEEKEVIKTVRRLQKTKKVTVILITHYMEEVIEADQVFVMDKGHVVMHGTPKGILSGGKIEKVSSGCTTGNDAGR